MSDHRKSRVKDSQRMTSTLPKSVAGNCMRLLVSVWSSLIAAILLLFAAPFGCSDADTQAAKNLQPFLDKISHSSESELPGFIYGYSQSSAGAQKVLLGMLRPLHAPSLEQHMSTEAVRRAGRFTMIVARVPWPQGTESAGLQPIIITGDVGHEQVVGYILPFNDILPLMQGADMQDITELSQWWIQNYGKKRGT